MQLDLGCGLNKKENYVGIDKYDLSANYKQGEFIQADLLEGLNFSDNSIDKIYISHFLEHIPQDKIIFFMNELFRVLKDGSEIEINVPPTTGRGAFADPYHKSYWNDLTFRVFYKSWRIQEKIFYPEIKCNFVPVNIEYQSEDNLYVVLKKVVDI